MILRFHRSKIISDMPLFLEAIIYHDQNSSIHFGKKLLNSRSLVLFYPVLRYLITHLTKSFKKKTCSLPFYLITITLKIKEYLHQYIVRSTENPPPAVGYNRSTSHYGMLNKAR